MTGRKKALIAGCAFVLVVLAALVVDEIVYYSWRVRMQSAIEQLESGLHTSEPAFFGHFPTRPASTYLLKPNRQFLLQFDPPLAVWSYHLGQTRLGYHVVGAWSSFKWWLVGARHIDSENAVEFSWRHTGYLVGIAACAMLHEECADGESAWRVWVSHGPQP